MNRLYDEWPIHGRTLSTGRTLKKNAGEISLTILAEIFAWYHDGVDSLTIYTQDTDAHEFQTNAERILTGNSEFTPALDSPISVAFKSNDFILCQMYREGALTLDAVRQLRHDDRKLTYTRQQADKSIICRKEVITKEQFIDLIQDATVQIAIFIKRCRENCSAILSKKTFHVCSATKERHAKRCLCNNHNNSPCLHHNFLLNPLLTSLHDNKPVYRLQ